MIPVAAINCRASSWRAHSLRRMMDPTITKPRKALREILPTVLMTKRVRFPDWPRLMTIEYAAAYLSRSPTVLRERGPTPKRDGRSVLYDRKDLDRWADELDGQPLAPAERELESKEVERRFLEKRRKQSR